jgi:DNA-binding transcriptional LysR family regulator
MYRIPPINCLATFEVLARVRSMKKAAEELCVTPSAISHRMRLMESILQRPLFDDVDFSLSPEGEQYLQVVRESLGLLQRHSFKPNSDLRSARVSTAH